MRIEGQRHGLAARDPGNAQGFLDQRPVPEMHAVEVPDGHGRIAQGATQVGGDTVSSSNGKHSLRDTGPISLRQLSSFSTSGPLSLLIAS